MEGAATIVILGFALYFTPFFIAMSRKAINAGPIGFLTLFVGWTVIGWITALIWACVDKPRQPEPSRQSTFLVSLPASGQALKYATPLGLTREPGETPRWAIQGPSGKLGTIDGEDAQRIVYQQSLGFTPHCAVNDYPSPDTLRACIWFR